MLNFLICGIVFLIFAWIKFRKRIFYPSVIFCLMWGLNCIYTAAILGGYGENLFLKDEYVYKYMDTYIIYFTIASLFGFSIAHKMYGKRGVHLKFSLDFLDRILSKYKFIMWVNFFGGILRIVLIISLVGFSLDNVMDYRLAANDLMNSGLGYVGLVFRLSSYVQMLANFYVALFGLRAGFGKLNFKKILIIFILYAPTQMATGGRLFVLYFIIFFFGSFFLARGLSMSTVVRKWILPEEKRAVALMFAVLLSIVAIIGMSRAIEKGKYVGKESLVEKFSYITEGMLLTDKCMQYYPDGSFQHTNGAHIITGRSDKYFQFKGDDKIQRRMSSVVISIIIPLYLDFGFWGSLIAWFIIALFIESFALSCLGKLTIIRFLIVATLLKIMYESVMSNPISGNIPVFQLIILFVLFYRPLLGRLERSRTKV